MEEQLISFKTAKLAKEKGFDLRSPAYYTCDEPCSGRKGNQLEIMDYIRYKEIGEKDSQEGTAIYSAPTQTLLQMWLREKYNIYAYVDWHDNSSVNWLKDKDIVKTYNHTDLEKLLQEALKLI